LYRDRIIRVKNMPQNENEQAGSLYRLNVKQNAKGETYCDFTVRGDTIDEVTTRTKEMSELAQEYSTVGCEKK